MNGWSPDLPRIPGHYWVGVPGFERAPDIAHVEDFGDGLVVRDDASGEWLPIEDVWGDTGALWWGPLMPPDHSPANIGDRE